MASKVFSETLANLSSEKAKDRTQGLDDARLFLTVERNLEWINQEPKRWLKLLQAVFQIVVDDQKAYVKKPMPAGLKRLKDSAQVVRVIIEKASSDIPKKAFRAVFDHIVSIVVVRGELFEPVALEYLKSLRTVLAYQPHLDHLEPKQWTHAVSLAFSVTLGDPIRSYDITDDKFDDDEDTEMTETATATQSRKRKAAGPLLKVVAEESSYRAGSPANFRSAGQDVIELMGCVEVLFSASSAPLMEYGEALLSKFTRFFRTFRNETSAHLPAVIALNRLVQELYYNSKALLATACVHIWPIISAMWPTKNSTLKEQIVLLASALLPFLIHRDGPSQTPLVQSLYELCLSEAESRWGIETLEIDHLVMGTNLNVSAVFQHCVFTAGHGFTASHALSWQLLELGAMCLRHLDNVAKSLNPDHPPTPASKGKKRRVEAPVDNLLDDLGHTSPRGNLVNLQILLFYLHTTMASLDSRMLVQICEAMQPLLSHANAHIQDWALLVFSTVSAKWRRGRSSDLAETWDFIWKVALRRVGSPVHSRAASLLLLQCIRNERVPQARLLQDIEALGRDLEVTGPPWAFDTVCELFVELLRLSTSDLRIHRLNLPEKIYNRMVQHWSLLPSSPAVARTFSSKPRSEALSVSSLTRLLCAVAGLSAAALKDDIIPLPDCTIVAQRQINLRTANIDDWYFRACLSTKQADPPRSQCVADGLCTTEATANPMAVRLVSYIRSTFHTILLEAASGAEAYWDSMTVEKGRRVLDISMVALLLDARLDACQVIRAERNTESAARIISCILPKLRSNKWSLAERAYVIAGLAPILLPCEKPPAPIGGLVHAGLNSGIRSETLRELASTGIPTGTVPPFADIQSVWSSATVRDVFRKTSVIFETLLAAEGEIELVGHQHQEDDEFGPIRTTTSVQMTGRALNDSHQAESSAICLSIAMGTLATMAYYEGGGQKAARLKAVVKAMLDGTGAQLALVGPHFLATVTAGFITLSPTELDDMVDRIGGELLPSYEYARSSQIHAFVLAFLKATTLTWGREETMELPFVDKARRLSAWFTAQILSENIALPSIRIAFIELAETFLQPELSTFAWSHESEPGACHQGVPIPPISILIRMLADQDFRVRFRLATVMGGLCAYVHAKQQQEYSVWESIAAARGFDVSGHGFESNISLLLAYANIMVASDYFRANAYNPIIVYAALDPSKSTSRYVSATLQGVASRLGIGSLASLYTFLAPYTMAEQILARQENLAIPDSAAFGFANKRDLYAASFAETAAMILAGPRPNFFDQMSTYAGLSKHNALRACLPIYIGYKLTAPLPEDETLREPAFLACVQEVDARVATVAKESSASTEAFMQGLQDVVVYRMFTFIWEPDYHIQALSEVMSPWPEARTSLAMVLASVHTGFRPNVLSPPDVALKDIMRVLHSKHPVVRGALSNEALLYVVLHRMTVSVAGPHFVSQQLRLLYNLAICIATASKVVSRSAILLRLLLQRLVRLLEQPDLTDVATSIFRWCLGALVKLPNDDRSVDYELGQVLAEAAKFSYTARASSVSAGQQAGVDLTTSLEGILTEIMQTKQSAWRNAALVALCLWPTTIPLHDKLSFRYVQQVLEDSALAFRDYSILRHLRSLLDGSRSSTIFEQIPKLLWRFVSRWKGTSRDDAKSNNEGISAFADLLMLGGVRLEAPGLAEVRSTGGVQARDQGKLQETIAGKLAEFLDVPELKTVSASFEAVKSIFAELQPGTAITIAGTEDMRMIAASAARSPLTISRQYANRLEDLKTEDWIRKGDIRISWQQAFAEVLTEALAARDEFFGPLLSAIQDVPNFAGAVLPELVHAILLHDAGQPKSTTKQVLSLYLTKLLQGESPVSADILDLVVALRAFSPVDEANKQSYRQRNTWLQISWKLLAEVAGAHQRPYAAMMFLELARDSGGADMQAETLKQQDLLYAVYSTIDDPDSFYSIKAVDPQAGLLRQLEHEGKWNEALGWHAGMLEAHPATSRPTGASASLIQALAKSDLPRMALDLLLPQVSAAGSKLDLPGGLEHHLAWKTEAWDLPLAGQQDSNNSEMNIFQALRAINRSLDISAVEVTLCSGLANEIGKILKASTHPYPSNPTGLGQIIAMRELQKTWKAVEDRREEPSISLQPLPSLPFEVAERVLSVRSTLLARARSQEALSSISDELSLHYKSIASVELEQLLDLAHRARMSNRLQCALNAILRAQDLAASASLDKSTCQTELAHILWNQKQPGVAMDVLQAVCSEDVEDSSSVAMEPQCIALLLAQMGEWKATARLESVTDIREKYFDRAVGLFDESSQTKAPDSLAKVASQYATFASANYRESAKQVAEIDRLEAYSRRKEAESKPTTNGKGAESSSDSSRRAVAIAQSQQDRQIVVSFRESRRVLLETALTMFGKALALHDGSDDAIFEFASLWMENAADDTVNAIVKDAAQAIPSHKFSSLIHQLSARLASGVVTSLSPSQVSFQDVLYGLVKRISQDHPFHSLYQIFFLRGTASLAKVAATRRISQGPSQLGSQVQRAAAVGEILQELRKSDRLRTTVQTLEGVLSAYTHWAMHPLDRQKVSRKPRSIPTDQPILKLTNLAIPITTYALPLDKTCRYDPSTFPCIKGFKPSYTTAGGLRLPKITECMGTDGKTYKQLYKGGDDVRQDAVMEQVFGIANQLLSRDESTRSRSLAIRTYKVIPLNADAGLLEFVENSQAIGEWLVPAHDLYNPRDMKIADARKQLSEYQKSPASERVETYKDIMKRVKPVMRHFFMEKHYIPERWFEMRLLYSRSVAVMSMVGHILGLGDRHVSNIMIDTAKGELVPIDLGIAFEAGRQLPTPELVPFRLTPDIVDGFGISGVEGVFRRCSEETMRVLRAQSAVFITILEVFRYDPLQKWAASVEKVKRVQGSQIVDSSRIDGINQMDGQLFTDADRAIATVARKLSSELSVEYQVNDLIMQATDVNNVGSIFHGWQPYL